MKTGIVLAMLIAFGVAGCAAQTGAAGQKSPAPVLSSSVTVTPTTTPIAIATIAPSPTLPAEPLLVGTTRSDTQISFEIAVAPLPAPVRDQDGVDRAKKIAALVGLTAGFENSWRDPDGTWRFQWAETFDGLPVEDGQYVLNLDADGTVSSFYQEIGPRAPKPATIITKEQAERAVGPTAKANDARLEWAKLRTDTFHLVWWLHFGTLNSEANQWPCVVFVDAGTAKVLDTACVS